MSDDLDKAIRTPAEIRQWFDVHGGTEAGRLAAVRAVRAILGLHDGARTSIFGDLQIVCSQDGQRDYDSTDLPGCRTTRAIDAEINHVLAGNEIETGPPVSSQDTAPAPRQARVWRKGDPEPPRDLVLADITDDRIGYINGGWAWLRIAGVDYGLTPWTLATPWADFQWDQVTGETLTEVLSPSTQTGGDQ